MATKIRSRTFLILFGFLALAGVVAPWTALSPTIARAGTSKPATTTINVLTRHSSSIYNEVEKAFKASSYAEGLGDIDILFWAYDGAQWAATIGQGDIDLGWGGGPTLFDQQMARGNLKPITQADHADILAEIANINTTYWQGPPAGTIAGSPMYRYSSGGDLMWVGSAIASFGFTINEIEIENRGLPEPSRWEHLAHPVYYRDTEAIAIGNAPQTTSNTRIYEIILQKYGWDLGWGVLTMMGGNAVIKPGSTEVLQAVEQGDVAIGTTIDFYGYEAEIEYEGNRYILPENQSIVNADPIAFTTNTHGDSARDALAAAFMEFVLSSEGQGVLLADKIKRMPIRSDAFDEAAKSGNTYEASFLTELDTLYKTTLNNTGILFDDPTALSYEDILLDYFEATVTNAHTELRLAAKAIYKAWSEDRMSDAQIYLTAMDLGEPLMTEAEAQGWNDQITTDQTFRETKKSEWRQDAKNKYLAVKDAVDDMDYDESPEGAENIPADNPFAWEAVSKGGAQDSPAFGPVEGLLALGVLGLAVILFKRRRVFS
ncbi:MAG: ABC transporter substrate-binding protein [Candidatus Thorarchaeota archaeon]